MTGEGRQRIDKWLFFARILKSRTLAAKLVQAGRVRVNGERIDQAAHALKPGDVLTINLDRRIAVLEVASPGTRRGPAEEAQTLYVDRSPPADPIRGSSLEGAAPLRSVGSGRPTKRERRALDRLIDPARD